MVLFFRVITIFFIIVLTIYIYRDAIRNREKDEPASHFVAYGIMGAVLNFLDTLGIGSNATQMVFFRLTRLSPDEDLPGNGNVIFSIPVAFEFLLFLGLIEVEPVTLFSMIAASMVGSYVGAKIMTKLPVNQIRGVLAVLLPIVAIVLVLKVNKVGPFVMLGTATGLTGGKLVIAVAVNFVLGALMSAGVGLYAPCMALCALLGMNLTVAFPIMMGSCSLLMPITSMEFVKAGRYNRNAALIAIPTGIVGVWFAYAVVKSMPIYYLTIIVACVLVYMSISFVLTIRKSSQKAQTSQAS